MDNHATSTTPQQETLLQETISFLRFPLIVAVVLIHCNFGGVSVGGTSIASSDSHPAYTFIRALFVEGIAAMAVPVFFFISGFLFFYKTDFSPNAYRHKLARRCRSLLIPYIFWNIVVIILILLSQTFMSGMTSGNQKLFADYTAADWLNCFWYYGNDVKPICYQFWFLRNLIVLVVFTPVVYFIVRRFGAAFIILYGVVWIADLLPVAGTSVLDPCGIIFFCWGAWYSANGKNFLAEMGRVPLRLAAAAYILLLAAHMCLNTLDMQKADTAVVRASVFIGLVAVVLSAATQLKSGRWRANRFLGSSTFFIYAYHGAAATLALKLFPRIFPTTDAAITAGMFALCAFLTALGLALYKLLDSLAPTFTSFICGGRKAAKARQSPKA